MRHGPIRARASWSGFVVVRLLRRWSACREAGEAQLPGVVRLGAALDLAPDAAIALASLFQLTEECLGRPLAVERCNGRISGDELAILILLASSPLPSTPAASAEIPHGLPGALVWAVRSVRRLMAGRFLEAPARPLGACPFEHGTSQGGSGRGAEMVSEAAQEASA